MKAKSVQNAQPKIPPKIPKEVKSSALKKVEEKPITDTQELSKDDLKKETAEASESSAVKEAISKATSVAKEAIKKPTSLPIPVADKLSDMKKGKAVHKSEPTLVKKPGLFFIGGMGLFSGGYGGVKQMSDAVKNAEHFHWDEQSRIIDEIKKRPATEPIVLVGHSLGGDSAIEIAKELNTLKNGFRQVDLLVTLDAVGWNNDIIPPNVKEHQNFIGENGLLFNGTPHIAKDTSTTKVLNELRAEDHTALDDSTDIQFKIFKSIQNVLGDRYSSTVAQAPSLKESSVKSLE